MKLVIDNNVVILTITWKPLPAKAQEENVSPSKLFAFGLKKKYHQNKDICKICKLILQGWYNFIWGCPCGVIVKAMDCRIVESEFELQLRYYIPFRTNTLGKGMNPFYPPSYGLNSTTTVLFEGGLWH